jgi:hypothetical protein
MTFATAAGAWNYMAQKSCTHAQAVASRCLMRMTTFVYVSTKNITRRAAMKSILDRSFKYVPAAKTDIKKLFRRIAAERKEQSAKGSNVAQINVSTKGGTR